MSDAADAYDRAGVPVVILAGGQGTRLREATEQIPKPMVPIGGNPILWHIMKVYSAHGFRRFVVCLGYKSWEIKRWFLDIRALQSDFTVHLDGSGHLEYHDDRGLEDWEVSLVETGERTGTGGRLHRVAHLLDADHFLYTYGDGLGAVDLGALFRFHVEHGRLATLTGVRPSGRYGELEVSGDAVVQFNEKPTISEGFVNGGFFACRREVLDYVGPQPVGLMFEQEPLQKIARAGELRIFRHEGFWMGMDTFREYSALNEMWEAGRAPWKTW